MRKSRWGSSANDHNGRRKSLNKRSLRNRFLRAEALENRVLLAADWINPWHNDLDPGDVNGDGWRAPNDVLHVVSELNRNGSRELAPGHIGGAEGEAGGEVVGAPCGPCPVPPRVTFVHSSCTFGTSFGLGKRLQSDGRTA